MTAAHRDRPPDFAAGRKLTEIAMGIDALQRSEDTGHGARFSEPPSGGSGVNGGHAAPFSEPPSGGSGVNGGHAAPFSMDGEGLVPIYMGRELVPPVALASWAEAHERLDDLEADIAGLPEGARKIFLRTMARSLRTATDMFSGVDVSFEEKLRDLVGVPAEPVADEIIDDIHARIDRLVTKKGYSSGDLAGRVRTWESERYIPSERIPALFEELMVLAKARTDAMIFPTGDYSMRLNTMRGVSYSARCDFNNGNMDMNLDVAVTRASLKHLVCHEVFPGHSTQLLYTHNMVERGESPADALLCTANSITGAVQEGIGDQGIELLDWVEDEDDAIQIEVRRLQTAVGTNAAFHLQVTGWTPEHSIDYLQREGFSQESWAIGRTAQAHHPFRGPFLASYWFGTEAVKDVRERTAPADRAAFLKYLYANVNSTQTLRMFHA